MWPLVCMLIPAVTFADMNDCVNIADQNKKNYCLASYSGSAAFCDKINIYEYRTQCMRMVISRQREATYQTPRPPTKEKIP